MKIFVSYAHEDNALRLQLRDQLQALEHVQVWDDRQIPPGAEWDPEIKQRLAEADIILLLISPPFIASTFVRTVEIPMAIARHRDGTARVIPVLLRPCNWDSDHLQLKTLQAFPPDEHWVTSERWPGKTDEALYTVARGIRGVIEELTAERERRDREEREETFRQAAADAIADGKISESETDTLDDLRDSLRLSHPEAAAIITGERLRVEQKRQNIDKYVATLRKLLEARPGRVLNDSDRSDLAKRQEFLGLTDDDVAGLAESVTAALDEPPVDPADASAAGGPRRTGRRERRERPELEQIALAAAPSIARVHCSPEEEAGVLRVLVVPRTPIGPYGEISFTDLLPDDRSLAAIGEALAPLTEARVVVEPPAYLCFTVVVEVSAEPDAEPEVIRGEALSHLYGWFSPLTGGRHQTGWPWGRGLAEGDVHVALQNVYGLTTVDTVRIFPANPVTGEHGYSCANLHVEPTSLLFPFEAHVRVR